MALIKCPECNQEVSERAAACPRCGCPIAPATKVANASAAPTSPGAPSPVILERDGVRVSKAKATFGNTTYAMANITSVAVSSTPPSNVPHKILGAATVLFGLAAFAERDGSNPILVPVMLAIICFLLSVFFYRRRRTIFHLVLRTAGAEAKALSSDDERYVSSLRDAIDEAIQSRG